MGLEWVFLIRGYTGSYFIIVCIVSYCWLDRIVSDVLDCIVSDGSGNTWFYELAGYWLYGTDGTDGLDGALVVRVWDGRTLAPAGTGVPPLDLEVRRAMGSGGWHQLRWCCNDAEYLCQRSKIIQIEYTRIRTNT